MRQAHADLRRARHDRSFLMEKITYNRTVIYYPVETVRKLGYTFIRAETRRILPGYYWQNLHPAVEL